jgi:type II secretory pathway component PulL
MVKADALAACMSLLCCAGFSVHRYVDAKPEEQRSLVRHPRKAGQ